jgi:hypothetical protein
MEPKRLFWGVEGSCDHAKRSWLRLHLRAVKTQIAVGWSFWGT